MVVCSIGDLLLDVVVRLREPLVPGDDAVAVTRAVPGGQAANVAAWAAALGASARFVGKRAGDEAGAVAHAALAKLHVEVQGPVVDGRTGVVVSMVGADGERTMASDRGVAPELRAEELRGDWFACDWLHVPLYSLAREPLAAATEAAVAAARQRGARMSLDLSSWTVARGVDAARVTALAPDVVFATERERKELELDAVWVVKRGAGGFAVDGELFSARATDVVDTTGAGDALAAGYLVGGPALAAETAARCVAQVGAMPS
jgi:sugar/nucleoside kinase (ribokinase family)